MNSNKTVSKDEIERYKDIYGDDHENQENLDTNIEKKEKIEIVKQVEEGASKFDELD